VISKYRVRIEVPGRPFVDALPYDGEDPKKFVAEILTFWVKRRGLRLDDLLPADIAVESLADKTHPFYSPDRPLWVPYFDLSGRLVAEIHSVVTKKLPPAERPVSCPAGSSE
jgi:hypothetical protein